MQDHLSIGPAPAEETPCQVGEPDYARNAKIECAQFIEAIRKRLGPEPEGARLSVKSNQHDFGTYFDVVCYYDPANREAIDYAFLCESDSPSTWDEVGMQAPRSARRGRA